MAKHQPIVDQVNVVVTDMAAAAEFYELLGCTVVPTPAPWDAHHREVRAGDGLNFDLDSPTSAGLWNEGWKGGTGVIFGFRFPTREAVDSVHADLIAAGHKSQQAPYDVFFGARYAVVEDPSGNAVGLMSPIDPSMRSAPPSLPDQ